MVVAGNQQDAMRFPEVRLEVRGLFRGRGDLALLVLEIRLRKSLAHRERDGEVAFMESVRSWRTAYQSDRHVAVAHHLPLH